MLTDLTFAFSYGNHRREAAAAGLPYRRGRRARGLRREEVAELAGISVNCYVRG